MNPAMNGYHFVFKYDAPTPGTITIPATSEEEARTLFNKMLEGFFNVEIYQVLDLVAVEAMHKDFLKQMEGVAVQESLDLGDVSPEDEKLSKPN